MIILCQFGTCSKMNYLLYQVPKRCQIMQKDQHCSTDGQVNVTKTSLTTPRPELIVSTVCVVNDKAY
jgi:hypothetical protein